MLIFVIIITITLRLISIKVQLFFCKKTVFVVLLVKEFHHLHAHGLHEFIYERYMCDNVIIVSRLAIVQCSLYARDYQVVQTHHDSAVIYMLSLIIDQRMNLLVRSDADS